MDFTREPIIETIITPKEGYKLVIRSSTNNSQEEFLVDSVEVVTFGQAHFYRSIERPKAFLVPVTDYEIVEVREARMVLKNVGVDRSIKIGGGRETPSKIQRETDKEASSETETEPKEGSEEARPELKVDKKRDRKKHYRKKRGREEGEEEGSIPPLEDEKVVIQPPGQEGELEPTSALSPAMLSALLQPPSTLISETINRYRQDDTFKGAFYLTEDEEYKPHDKVQELLNEDDEDSETPPLQQPEFDSEEEASKKNPGGDESAEFLYVSEEETILKSRMPLLPADQDAVELPPESAFEPSEKPIEDENKPHPVK